MNRLLCAHCAARLPAPSFNAGETLCPDCHGRWFAPLAVAQRLAALPGAARTDSAERQAAARWRT